MKDAYSGTGQRLEGGRILKVAVNHLVTGRPTQIRVGDEPELTDLDNKPAIAEPGDLVIELLDPKKKVVGYAYLSGSAMRRNNSDVDPALFVEADVVRMDVRPRAAGETMDQLTDRLIKSILTVRFKHDAGGFEHRMKPGEGGAEQLEKYLGDIYAGYQPVAQDGESEDDKPKDRGHVFGVIYDAQGALAIHFRPPGQGAKCPKPKNQAEVQISVYQIKLAVSTIKKIQTVV